MFSSEEHPDAASRNLTVPQAALAESHQQHEILPIRIHIGPAHPVASTHGGRTQQTVEPPDSRAEAAAGSKDLETNKAADASPLAEHEDTKSPNLPESLRVPTRLAGIRDSGASSSSPLLSAIQPVSLTENISDDMLVEKVMPSYPDEALRSGEQGEVVLQAWIAKDGSVRDLKLISGSLVLGKAAVDAVKHWRYKPYIMNGHAAEALTYVTVNFKMPPAQPASPASASLGR